METCELELVTMRPSPARAALLLFSVLVAGMADPASICMGATGLDWERSGSERVRADEVTQVEEADTRVAGAGAMVEDEGSTPHMPGPWDNNGSETGTCMSGCTLNTGGVLCCLTVCSPERLLRW